MNPISAQELSAIQNDVVVACDKTCVIQRKAMTDDDYGSQSTTYSTVATVKAGMTQPSAGQLANYAFRISDLAAWNVKFAVGTDVRETDRLVIDGQTLEVHVVLTPRSYMGLLTVIAAELK